MVAFCRFTVGTPGASAVFLRYIARPRAVREGLGGCLLHGMPELETRSYADLRASLEAYGWAREESELATVRGGTGATRTHYRAVLSFEGEMPSAAILAMAREWLTETMPTARAAVFVHRNTDHVHAHVWIDARGSDGKKLDLSPRRYRSLGARWERVYARELALRGRLGSVEAKELSPEREQREEGRTGGGGEGARIGARKDEKARGPLTPGEQAARACARSRAGAVRAAEGLRRELEGLRRGREARGFEEGGGRDR